jgi:hypothetical protein
MVSTPRDGTMTAKRTDSVFKDGSRRHRHQRAALQLKA